ncbi:hypothetical protein DSECCO2_332310 [anaerobic digester metagenome]
MQNIKNEIMNYIKTHPGTSYVEIERLFDKLGFEWAGDYCLCSSKCSNVIYWSGWNNEAVQILNELQEEGFIEKTPTEPVIYLIDGKGLNLPLVKSFKQYKNPHWLPIVFNRIGVKK